MLQSRPGICGKELSDGRTKEEIANAIAGNKSSAPPWPADLKFQGGAQIARVQMLVREWTRFMNGAATHGEPVEEWRTAHIEELAEEVLVQLHRRFSIPPQSEFNPGIENDASITQMHDRGYPYVENGVVGIAVHDSQLAGNRERAAEIAFPKITADRDEILWTVPERATDLDYLLRTRWRRSSSTEEPVVQFVDGGVFEDGFSIEAAEHGGVRGNRCAFFSGSLQHSAFGNVIFCCKLVGVRVG